jgi:hypothetical protein
MVGEVQSLELDGIACMMGAGIFVADLSAIGKVTVSAGT